MLINFRNRYLGHGLTLDKETSHKLWGQYYPIFQQLLIGLEWCKNYTIFKSDGKIPGNCMEPRLIKLKYQKLKTIYGYKKRVEM